MKFKKIIKSIFCVLLMSVSFMAFAEEKILSASDFPVDSLVKSAADVSGARTLSANPQLAMSSGDYPVTAGDVYALSFAAGTTPVSYTVSVDSTYKFRVANLAVLNVQGWTFVQLKKQVEEIVAKNYPMSGVQFVLVSPAVFQVTLIGEVKKTEIRQAWPLSRLSSLVKGCFTDYSSSRDIVITSTSGKQTHYDLFLADRFGDLSQDPYVRPGDIITINRAERRVKVTGAVERPDSYELRKDENLLKLFDYYCGGFTSYADKNRIEIHRFNPQSLQTNVFYLTEKNLQEDFSLYDLDLITVVSSNDLRPVMFIEGAVTQVITKETTSTVASMDKLNIRFDFGTNYATLLRTYASTFLSSADLSSAYIVRDDNIIPIDINKILYNSSYFSEEIVQPYDVLRIPFRLYYVTVSGAVTNPGRYAYIPDRDWEYYIGLAGGFIDSQNIGKKVEIRDVNGKILKRTDPITPETTIKASANRASHIINQNVTPWLSIISAIASTITAVFGIMALMK